MLITVIICTYNRAKFLPIALNSFTNQTLDNKVYEIIIVNNNSTDNTEKICKEFITNHPELNVKYFIEKNQGLSFSRNRGFRESSCGIIAYLDDDAYVEDDYLENIISFFQSNDTIAVGGQIFPVYDKGKEEPIWLSKYVWGVVGKVDFGNDVILFPEHKYPAGSNMIIDRNVLEESGLFNTKLGRIGRFGIASEEKDLFDRIRKKVQGKIYYLPNIPVYHIIEEQKLSGDYLKKFCIGIGLGEKVRTRHTGFKELFEKFIEYIFKFVAAFGLALLYAIKFEFPKAKYIVLIRYYILSGFFKSENKQ